MFIELAKLIKNLPSIFLGGFMKPFYHVCIFSKWHIHQLNKQPQYQ